MECARRAICELSRRRAAIATIREPLRRRTAIAAASLCSVFCKRYTMLRLKLPSAAPAARI
eukprot:3850225-Lingulodinium_polyedra.AAC.1